MAAPVEKGSTIQCLMQYLLPKERTPQAIANALKADLTIEITEKNVSSRSHHDFIRIYFPTFLYMKNKKINIFDEINGIVFVFGVYLQPALAEAAHAVAKATTNPSIFRAVFKHFRNICKIFQKILSGTELAFNMVGRVFLIFWFL